MIVNVCVYVCVDAELGGTIIIREGRIIQASDLVHGASIIINVHRPRIS